MTGGNHDPGTAEATPPPPGGDAARGREEGRSYLSHFVTEQDEDQRVEDQLGQVRHRVEVHEQHVREQQQEGDVEEDVPGEDHEGRGEEGHVAPQELPAPVRRLLPGRGRRPHRAANTARGLQPSLQTLPGWPGVPLSQEGPALGISGLTDPNSACKCEVGAPPLPV